LGALLVAGRPIRAAAQAVGSEFQVNSYTTGHQRTSDPAPLATSVGGHLIAADASGNFVVVWASYGQDGSHYGVFGQRYDAAGAAVAGEFGINSHTPLLQHQPAVASDASGNFVVVWTSDGQDGSLDGVFGQRYDSGGAALGAEFRVNSYTTSNQRYPDVASDPAGSFVVVWSSHGQGPQPRWDVFGQRYDSGGAALGGEFRVNSFTTGDQRSPSVASDASGNFVVAWQDDGSPGQDDGVFVRRFDGTGTPLAPEFRANTYATSIQASPSVASDAGGDFVVAWSSKGQDGSSDGIFARRYDATGAPQGPEFQVNSYTQLRQRQPSVASDASGNFVVAWGSSFQDGSGDGSFGQRYDSAGAPRGSEFPINSYTTGNQVSPALAATGMNRFVVAWESNGQDGSRYGVFGQRFDFSVDSEPPDVTVMAPNGGEKVFADSSYLIRWTASDDIALASLDVFVSADAGQGFTPIAECQDLPGSAASCLWLAPAPLTLTAIVRIAAEDTSGNSASDDSDAVFKIHSGTAKVTVANPNVNKNLRIGSLENIKWTHNLGGRATFRIELDRDDDGSYEELIAAAAPATTTQTGIFAWTVTGPPTTTARVRISWTGNPGSSDSSDVTFRIRT
jgi:hypothetical protein